MFISAETETLVQQFKALADPQRIRVLMLCKAGELSVGELVDVLGQSQPRVSQHLKLLCAAGLLRRFRDGKRVFYRWPSTPGAAERRLLAALPEQDPRFDADLALLRNLRTESAGLDEPSAPDTTQRTIARALIELTVSTPVGDLLDIGCGRGRLLKLLASRARRAIGVDIDSAARSSARAELFLAGLSNCSLRKGDMYDLEFDDASFDTIILDDVLGVAKQPQRVLTEAARLLRTNGRLLVLHRLDDASLETTTARLAPLTARCHLRMTAPRPIPAEQPEWLLSTLTHSAGQSAVA